MSSMFTLEGWPNSPSSDNAAHKYNNDTGLWDTGGAPANSPFTGQLPSGSVTTVRKKGGWDGSYWYVIGPDGKLYRYNPTPNTWSAALVAGAVIVTGTISAANWCMASDGRFIYILSSGGDFVRYDPTNDMLHVMPTIGGTAGYDGTMFLVYDNAGNIYGLKNSTSVVQKFNIATAGWTALPAQPSPIGNTTWGSYAAFLQGVLVHLYKNSGATNIAYTYNPGTNTWSTKSTTSTDLASYGVAAPYGEDTDATIRVWPLSAAGTSKVYNVQTDTWSDGANGIFTVLEGANWAVARAFAPAFSWFLADGVTPANADAAIGTVNQGGTLTYEFQVQTPVDCPSGITVSVPVLVASDASQPVTVCQTAGGTFGTSFTTAALVAGNFVTVFVKVAPTTQTAGLNKTFNLHPVKL